MMGWAHSIALVVFRASLLSAVTCGDYYFLFLWESGKFRLLFKQPLKLNFWTNGDC